MAFMEDLAKQLALQEEKIDKIYASVEKMRKYFMWTLIITVVLFVVPLIGLIFVIPQFLSTYTQALNF